MYTFFLLYIIGISISNVNMCNLRFEIVNKKVDIRLAGVFINYVYSIRGTLIVYILFNNKTALSFVVSIMCHDCYPFGTQITSRC